MVHISSEGGYPKRYLALLFKTDRMYKYTCNDHICTLTPSDSNFWAVLQIGTAFTFSTSRSSTFYLKLNELNSFHMHRMPSRNHIFHRCYNSPINNFYNQEQLIINLFTFFRTPPYSLDLHRSLQFLTSPRDTKCTKDEVLCCRKLTDVSNETQQRENKRRRF